MYKGTHKVLMTYELASAIPISTECNAGVVFWLPAGLIPLSRGLVHTVLPQRPTGQVLNIIFIY